MEPEELLRFAEEALNRERNPWPLDAVNRRIREQTGGRFRDITQLRGAVQTRSGRTRLEQVPGSFARGFGSIGTGLAQLGLEAFGPEGASAMLGEEAAREREGDEPVSRFLGQTAALAPLMLIPGGQQTLLARLAAGGAAGGLAGAVMPTESGQTGERAFNTLVGGASGAAVPEFVRGGIRAATRAAQGLGRRLGIIGPSDDALARQADFERLGVTPTTGQVTRNPRQLARERNLAQIEGVGEDIAAIRAGQAGQLTEALDEAVPGERVTQTEAGRRIMGTLGSRTDEEGIFRRMGEQIDELFDAARNAPGVEDALDAGALRQTVAQTVDDFEDAIPNTVLSRIRDFGDDRALTVGEAFKLRQLINRRSRATNDPATAAGLSQLKRDLDGFLTAAGDEGVGGEAMELYRRANDAARRRAQAFSGRPLEQTVAGQIAPDDFVNRFVIGGAVDDLRQMRATLIRKGGDEGRRAWDTTRRQVVDYLLDKSVNDAGNFSAARYNSALERIGSDKLSVLFNDQERGQLFRIGRAATNLFSNPPTGGVPVGNVSGTAAGNVSAIPGLGFAQQLSRGRAAARAASGSPFDTEAAREGAQAFARTFTNPFGLNPFAAPGGLLGALVTQRTLDR